MASSKRVNTTATARLKQDYLRILKDPIPYVQAAPLPANILEWHYVVQGPENSPYEGGIYHGKLVFPREFPFRPPSIYMITPNGRFKTNTRLCLSISDFHPDTWNPAWSVSTILTGLLSFMLESAPTLGSVETSTVTRRQLAANSGAFNLNNRTFCELFGDVAERIRQEMKEKEEEEQKKQAASLAANGSAASSNGAAAGGQAKVNGQGKGQGRGGEGANRNQGIIGSALTNICVIFGLAAFAFTVKYVLRNVVD